MKRPVNLGGKKSAPPPRPARKSPTGTKATKPANSESASKATAKTTAKTTGKSTRGSAFERKKTVETGKKPGRFGWGIGKFGSKSKARPAGKFTAAKASEKEAKPTAKTEVENGGATASKKSLKLGKSIEISEDAGKSKPFRELLHYRVGASERRRGVPITVLLLAVLVAFVLLGKPTYTALVQYDQYRHVQEQLETARKENEQLRRELALWSNPDYIESQARERLGFARPGEYQYLVLDPGPEYQDRLRSLTSEQVDGNPWFVKLVQTTQQADEAARSEDVAKSHKDAGKDKEKAGTDEKKESGN